MLKAIVTREPLVVLLVMDETNVDRVCNHDDPIIFNLRDLGLENQWVVIAAVANDGKTDGIFVPDFSETFDPDTRLVVLAVKDLPKLMGKVHEFEMVFPDGRPWKMLMSVQKDIKQFMAESAPLFDGVEQLPPNTSAWAKQRDQHKWN